MLKAKGLCYRLVKSRKATTCALPSEPSSSISAATVSAASGDHRSRCLSLIVKLGRRGLVDSALEVIRRVIDGCSSISEAALVADFAVNNGIELDSCCCGALISKLTEMGQPGLAETFYNQRVIGNGIVPGSSVLDSMVYCLVKLRRFDEARAHLDKIIASGYVPSINASSLIVDELCNQYRFLEAFHCFEQVKKRGSGLWLWCCKRLFKGLCGHGHLNEAIGMLDTLCEMTRMPLPINLYKSLFYGFCSRGCAAEAEALFDHMEADGYFVDKVMYTCLMKEYCKDNNMTMAMRLYLRMVEKSCELDPCIFNTLIHGFMKLGMLEKGRVMFSQMIKKGVRWNVFTYHIMIGSYCKEGNVDYAFRLFENNRGVEDISRNVHCYTNLISGFYKKGGLDKAVDLLTRMLDDGIVPDHITYFVLLKMLPKCHELKYAMVILQAIFDNGCGIDPPVIDDLGNIEVKVDSLLEEIARKDVNLAAVGLAVVTTALCSQRNFTAALSRIEKMVNLGCTPLPFSYNSVIKCLFQEGVIKDLASLVNLIQELDFVPDLDTYLIMVNELCKNIDRDAAFAVIDVMEELGLRPTVAIYRSIIGSLGKHGRVVEAEETFAKMLESGIQSDEIAYMIMINAYARNARINEANELVEEVVKHFVRPSSFTYTVLISGFVMMGMMEKGCLYLDKMLEDSLSPNIVLYTSLISHFLKKGDFKFSFTLFGLMGENKIKGGKKDEERQRIALKKEKAKAIAVEAEKKKKTKKSYNWTTEVKSERENGEVSHTYMIKASTGGEKGKHEEKEKKDKKEKKSKKKEKTRVVAIEEEEEEENESEEHGAIVLRKLLGRIASKDPLMAAPWQWENATAGAVAGFATVAAIHPLDVVRTRFQVNDGRGSSLPTYKNTAHAVFTIGRLEGLRGLYAGFFPAVIGSTVSWGLYFYFYGRAKQRYAKGRDDEKLSPGLHLASAAEAGALVCLCTNPIWLVKTRLQLQTPLHRTQPYSGLLDAFRTIVKEEGPRALYKGIVPGLVLVSHGAIQFTAYEELRKIIVDLKERRRKSESADNILNSADYAALGGSSKVAAVLLTYPFQVIRARLQQRPSTNGIPRYIDSLHVIRETARFEGLRGFYRGLTANLLKNVPASSITFIVYENVLKLLKQPPTKD